VYSTSREEGDREKRTYETSVVDLLSETVFGVERDRKKEGTGGPGKTSGLDGFLSGTREEEGHLGGRFKDLKPNVLAPLETR